MSKLYSARVCPFCHRARLALAEKNIAHEVVEIDLRDTPKWYLELSPKGKVPLLEHEGHRLLESLVIAEYAEEGFAGPRLLPADALGRALVREAIALQGDGFMKATMAIVKERTAENEIKLHEALAQLEGHEWYGGPYWVGSQCTLADLALYPFFERWPQWDLPWREGQYPELDRWLDAMRSRPAVQKEMSPPEFYEEQYRKLSKVSP